MATWNINKKLCAWFFYDASMHVFFLGGGPCWVNDENDQFLFVCLFVCTNNNVAVINWFNHCNPIDGSSFGDASKTFNLFCNPGAGNPFDFCAVFSKQNWIASPWSRYNIFRITKSDITHALWYFAPECTLLLESG